MVLVGMGEDDARQALALALDEGGVGGNDVDPRHGVVAEGNAEIDDNPFPLAAVEVEVHADFARPAERQEQQLLARHRRALGQQRLVRF